MRPPHLLPPRLRPGDMVGICAPSSPVLDFAPDVELAVKRLQRRGFRVKLGANLWQRGNRTAGTVQERLADFHQLWADPAVKAVIPAVGGIGAAMLVDGLDYDLIRQNPKVFVGMSDVSILTAAIHARAGLVTFHGSNLVDGFGSKDAKLEAPHFLQVVGEPVPAGPLPDWAGGVWALRPGRVRGRLLPMNLPCATHLLGTPYWPDTTGALLMLEAVGQSAGALARWLTQLRLTGDLGRCAALIFGHLERCCTEWEEPGEGLRWAVEHALSGLDLPVFQIGGFGHMVPNVTLPVGCMATMDGNGLRIEEAAVV